MNNKETTIKIIEFYLYNRNLILREVQYRRQMRNTKLPVTINKLYKSVNFEEISSISDNIEHTVIGFDGERKEYIGLRYRSKCTYDVICGLMNRKRSTVYSLGIDIINEILFNILIDDKARFFILNADTRSYILNNSAH